MNKKLVKPAFFIAFSIISAVFFTPAHAASLPPGNPFYPFQRGMWQLRRALTFNPVAKALLEIRLVNERHGDIVRLLNMHADESVLTAVFQAYSNELNTFAEQAKSVQDDAVLSGAAHIVIEHAIFFSDVMGNPVVAASADVRFEAMAIKESLFRFALDIFEKGAGGAFRARIRATTAGFDSFKKLRVAETFAALEIQTLSADALKKIEFAKDDMLAAFIGKIKRGDGAIEKIDWAEGDALARFEALDAARYLVDALETRNALTGVRARALEQADISRLITPVAVRKRIDYVKDVSAAFGLSSEQKTYFIEQAEKFFSEGAYVVAFQHAVSARAEVINLLMEKTIAKNDLREEIMVLKETYDGIKIRPAFMEKRIAAVADMVGRFSAGDVLAAIREVKLTLAFSDN